MTSSHCQRHQRSFACNFRTVLERVIEKLLDYVLDADNIRGTGLLYLP